MTGCQVPATFALLLWAQCKCCEGDFVSGWHHSQCLSPRRDAFMLTARLLTTFYLTLALAVFRDSTPVLAETVMCIVID